MTNDDSARSKALIGLCRAVVIALACALPVAVQAGTATYKYDALGRLSEIEYDNGLVMRYAYDATGNRTADTAEWVTGNVVPSAETKAALEAVLMLLLDD